MLDNTNEVYAFGTETIQVYAPSSLNIDPNDPNNILDFAPARTMNIGTVSPHSIIAIDDTFAMLDRNRRFILTDARTYTDISAPVAQILRDMKSIADVWGFRMRFGRFDCIVWMFPTDGFGLIYDMKSARWSEWRERGVQSYDYSGSPVHTGSAVSRLADHPVSITSAYNWAEKGMFLLGLSNGTIAALDDTSPTDLAFDDTSTDTPYNSATSIKVEVQSGHIDHGSTEQKHCKTLLLKLRRTFSPLAPTGTMPANVLQSPSGVLRVSKRDDQGAWKLVKEVALSDSRAPSVQMRSLGVYRSRQWKLEYSGLDEIQIVSAQEEFEILGA
jgi:hypothetical protein